MEVGWDAIKSLGDEGVTDDVAEDVKRVTDSVFGGATKGSGAVSGLRARNQVKAAVQADP